MANASTRWDGLVPDRQRPPGWKALRATGRLLGVVMLSVLLGATLTAGSLPVLIPAGSALTATVDEYTDFPPLPDELPDPAERTAILASDDSTLAYLYRDEDRRTVALDSIPDHAVKAVLAIEDSRFYEHDGVDFRGIARAAFTNAEDGGISQGGSTLTQQYVKLLLTGNEPNLERKVREASYALDLEQQLSKDEILEGYLNLAYFGEGVYGIATAAEHYYSKDVQDLTVGEAAALAATIARPEGFKPTNEEVNTERRGRVLDRMEELGYADPTLIAEARANPSQLNPGERPDRFPFFYTYIRNRLLTDPAYDAALGPVGSEERAQLVFQGGLRVTTTVMPDRQQQAQDAVDQQLAPAQGSGPTGAMASVDPRTGAVVALVGGQDYDESEVNLAVRGLGGDGYQPGSAFKPFFAVAALEQGISPRLVLDSPAEIEIRNSTCEEGWKVGGGADQLGGDGRIDMYTATARSVNTYYAQLAAQVGPEAGLEVARKLGITGIPEPGSPEYANWAVCSLVLGVKNVSVLDMASAYATLANDGVRCDQHVITAIVARDGSTLHQHQDQCERVVTEQVARTTNDMLQGGPRDGTGTRAQIGRPVAGKTGTAQNYTSAFFSGYSPDLSTSVWVGHPDEPRPMPDLFNGGPVFGGTYPALIFRQYMEAALQGVPPTGFTPPPPPEESVVPDVRGQPFEQARQTLEGAGFVVQDPQGQGPVVVAVDPAPGTPVGRGSTVRTALGQPDLPIVQPPAGPTQPVPPAGQPVPQLPGQPDGIPPGLRPRPIPARPLP